MNKPKLDLFKIAAVLLMIWLCYSLHEISINSKNGRYVQWGNFDVLDTRTGAIYSFDSNNKPYKVFEEISHMQGQ